MNKRISRRNIKFRLVRTKTRNGLNQTKKMKKINRETVDRSLPSPGRTVGNPRRVPAAVSRHRWDGGRRRAREERLERWDRETSLRPDAVARGCCRAALCVWVVRRLGCAVYTWSTLGVTNATQNIGLWSRETWWFLAEGVWILLCEIC